MCSINTRDDRAHKNVNYPIYNNYKQKLLDDVYDDGEVKKERKKEKKKTVENFHFFWHTHTQFLKGFRCCCCTLQ